MNSNRNILPRIHVESMPEKVLRHIALCVILSVLIAVATILSPAFSLMNSIIIGNMGNISASAITAKSGSIDDLQAAINAVHTQGSGTVYIPAGTFAFDPNGSKTGASHEPIGVQSYGGINIIGAGADKTILQETVAPTLLHTSMIDVDGSNGLSFRISGIKFQGCVTNTEGYSTIGIQVWCGVDYRIDHCWLDSLSGNAIGQSQDGSHTNRGVIDHNNLTQSYKTPSMNTWGYGIIIGDLDYTKWSTDASLIGQYYGANDIVYVENNWFNECRHAVDCNQNGYYVARYNNITNENPPNYGMFSIHGFNFGRGAEIYNNTFTATSGYGGAQGMWLRGGTCTVFNNTFINCSDGVMLFNESAPQYQVNNSYFWSNTMEGGGTVFVGAPAYTENVNYFLYARPGYTPFTYPHPLTLQGTP